MSILITSTHVSMEVLAGARQQEKDIKDIYIGWERVKLFLFARDIMVYIDNLMKPTESY